MNVVEKIPSNGFKNIFYKDNEQNITILYEKA